MSVNASILQESRDMYKNQPMKVCQCIHIVRVHSNMEFTFPEHKDNFINHTKITAPDEAEIFQGMFDTVFTFHHEIHASFMYICDHVCIFENTNFSIEK